MKESAAKLLIKEMKAAGIDFVSQLPDSGLAQIYFLCRDDPDFEFVQVTNEGEGVAVAAGAWLVGKKSIACMEASGLRVAGEALARLGIGLGVPVLLLISYRGSIGDGNWWAVNQGIVLEPMLKALCIPYTVIEKEEDIEGSIQRALKTTAASKNHVAIVMSGGTMW
jgi:sulfopyruvate decarboxylase subunit alpha